MGQHPPRHSSNHIHKCPFFPIRTQNNMKALLHYDTEDAAMRLNAGIITNKHNETKEFYTETLNFGITFESDFYLLLHTPNKKDELAFLKPEHPSQHPILHPKFGGKGMFLTLEVGDVDILYEAIKAKGVSLALDIRDEPWGDRHFALLDPNGIVIDIVTYQKPE